MPPIHDYVIANQTGANTRSDLNTAFSAIVSNNSSATEPTTTYAYQWWADTGNDLLKQRNAADSAWISILTLSTGAVSSGGATEGTAVLSTGETGGTKYLREDGDGTSSWQSVSSDPAMGGDLTGTASNAQIAANAVGLAEMAGGTDGNLITYDASGDPAYVTTGTSGQVLTSGGVGVAPTFQAAAGGGLQSQQVFTSSGTWTKPSGINTIKVTATGGGGGGGGGGYSDAGGGGGGGGTSIEIIDVSSVSSVAVTIGVGGAGCGTGSCHGTVGGATSFASYCSATGGQGGRDGNGAAQGGVGGVGSGGDINLYGNDGNGGSDDQADDSGTGGGSFFGGAGKGAYDGGASAQGHQGGGGGGATGTNAASAGGSGIVIVEEYA